MIAMSCAGGMDPIAVEDRELPRTSGAATGKIAARSEAREQDQREGTAQEDGEAERGEDGRGLDDPAHSVRNPAPTIQPAVSTRPRSPAIAIAT